MASVGRRLITGSGKASAQCSLQIIVSRHSKFHSSSQAAVGLSHKATRHRLLSSSLSPRSLSLVPYLIFSQKHRSFPYTCRYDNRTAPIVRLFETLSDYHDAADATLDHIAEVMDGIVEDREMENVECEFSDGVLTITFYLEDEMTKSWVFNKQAPNRQIWWSSPISGPKRYEYDNDIGRWVNTRDREALSALLRKEMSEMLITSAGGGDLAPEDLPFEDDEI